MKRWIGPLAVTVIAALAAHWATLAYTPGFIMDRTLATLKNRGISQHAFTTPQRITPQTQAVVRTSPDLFYSLCRYDLSKNGSALRIEVGEWPYYQSLSFFDAETNNFETLRATGQPVSALLAMQDVPIEPEGALVKATTTRGVVLIRRLAPTPELFEKAREAAKADRCELITL
ncbi:MAG: DUF1254 domain-containing protein [Pseudomonadota bacterium]